MKKKILICGIILGLSAIQIPAAQAFINKNVECTSWADVAYRLNTAESNLFSYSIIMSPNNSTFTQDSYDDQPLYPYTIYSPVSLLMKNGTLVGSALSDEVLEISDEPGLTIYGGDVGGVIKSNKSNGYSISLVTDVALGNVTLANGIITKELHLQENVPYITIGFQDNTTTKLSGNNNIWLGGLYLASTNTTLIFDGGTLSESEYVDIAGGTNSFKVTNGNVALNGVDPTYDPFTDPYSSKDDWKDASIYLSGPQTSILTLDQLYCVKTHDLSKVLKI